MSSPFTCTLQIIESLVQVINSSTENEYKILSEGEVNLNVRICIPTLKVLDGVPLMAGRGVGVGAPLSPQFVAF